VKSMSGDDGAAGMMEDTRRFRKFCE
jgi:hypothetical protein